MAIYRQKESRYWWASIYRGKDKPRLRVSTGVQDEETARDIERQLQAAHSGRRSRDRLVNAIDELTDSRKPRSIRIGSIWAAYAGLPDLNLAAETLRIQKVTVKRLITMLAEDWPAVATMADVTRDVALDVTDRLRDECARGKTFNNIKGVWGTVWRRLMVRGGISENVWALIPNASTSDSLHGRAFTEEEESALLAACRKQSEELYGASLIARHTGLRYKDVVHLDWNDFHGSLLRVVPSKTQRHGITVVLPVMPAVSDWLVGWRPQCRGSHVFPDLRRKYGKTWYTSVYVDLIRSANIEPAGAYLSFACWRHTLETRLVAAGVAREVRNRITGRSKTSVLGDTVYNHDLTSIRAALQAAAEISG